METKKKKYGFWRHSYKLYRVQVGKYKVAAYVLDKIVRAGAAAGIINVSRKLIGKRFKVILIPMDPEDQKDEKKLAENTLEELEGKYGVSGQ